MKTSRIRIYCSFYEGDDTLSSPTGAKKTQSKAWLQDYPERLRIF